MNTRIRIPPLQFAILLAFVPALHAEVEAAATETRPTASVVQSPQEQLAKTMEEVYKLYEAEVTDVAAYAKLLEQLDAMYAVADSGDFELRASIGGAKGMIYQHVLNDLAAAKREYERLVVDCAGSDVSAKATARIARIEIQMALVAGAEFPVFSFSDLEGKSISLADYRGKVVLVDFWATWCPPCVAEMPEVIAVYKEFHDKGFEIIGISLDKDLDKLKAYISTHGMKWPQYYDGKGWDNELSNRYGVSSIPATFLIGPDGRILHRDIRGEDLKASIAKALE